VSCPVTKFCGLTASVSENLKKNEKCPQPSRSGGISCFWDTTGPVVALSSKRAGITRAGSRRPADEAPFAYDDIETVLQDQKDPVDVRARLGSVLNDKGV
jgi:hypothetical protein